MISGATRLAAVIGSPVAHSRSPAIHNAAFAAVGLDWRFVAFDVADGEAPAALDAVRVLGLGGLSVTMPHKHAVFRNVDECSEEARTLEAVNCVVPLTGGRLRGLNTDGAGFVAAVREAGFEPEGRRALVVGGGGAARAVVLALAGAGVLEVAVENRTWARAASAAALAGERGRVAAPGDAGDVDLVVNATSLGMGASGRIDPLPVDVGLLGAGQVVVDLVYDPLRTPLLDAAARAGCHVVDGLGMLVHQAAAAFDAWTGVAAPTDVMRAAAVGDDLPEHREEENPSSR